VHVVRRLDSSRWSWKSGKGTYYSLYEFLFCNSFWHGSMG